MSFIHLFHLFVFISVEVIKVLCFDDDKMNWGQLRIITHNKLYFDNIYKYMWDMNYDVICDILYTKYECYDS